MKTHRIVTGLIAASLAMAALFPRDSDRPSELSEANIKTRTSHVIRVPFNDPASIVRYTESGQHWARFSGNSGGRTWLDDLAALGDGRFQFLVTDGKRIDDHVALDIRTVNNHGRTVNALYMAVKKDDPNTPDNTRVQYNLHPRPGVNEYYIRYRMMLPTKEEIEILWPVTTFGKTVVMELWEGTAAKYRLILHIWRSTAKHPRHVSDLYWQTELTEHKGSRCAFNDVNTEVPVPLGEWFDIELFIKRDAADGVWYCAVNGRTVFCHRGRTMFLPEIDKFNIIKLYPDMPCLTRAMIYQYVTDLEIRWFEGK